jgi:uncharacterized membrane protein YdbT with pleckstrin-like domain
MTTINPAPVPFYLRHYIGSTIVGALFLASSIILPLLGLDLWFSGALVGIGLLVLGVGIAHTLLHCRETALTLSGMQLTYSTGILQRRIATVAVGQITDSLLNQDLTDKLLGTATFKINTSGSTSYEIDDGCFPFVAAKSMRDDIYALIDKPKTVAKKSN